MKLLDLAATYITTYASKNPTFDSDGLNAFLGVLRTFEEWPTPIYHVWGLLFDKLSSLLLLDLAWHHKTPVRRRGGLPSWSWAGWEGVPIFDSSAVRLSESDDPLCGGIQARFEDEEGRNLTYSVLQRRTTRQPACGSFRVSPCLRLRGLVVKVKLQRVDCVFAVFSKTGEQPAKRVYCRVPLANRLVVQIPPFMDTELSLETDMEDFEGLVLPSSYTKTWILILKKRSEFLERIGIVEFQFPTRGKRLKTSTPMDCGFTGHGEWPKQKKRRGDTAEYGTLECWAMDEEVREILLK
ncbi:hypothetical protein QBC38DRAFT_34363 [Podospora fimiseda]|uniref:Uncharacterized protein n=1 Tax=Podospora fimiseda TaxID=252190 RepID=A0AAN7BIE8_9PEZI|nr:hypothetical protein QBC38DRAFT_34363 [Podospora fimiseda]